MSKIGSKAVWFVGGLGAFAAAYLGVVLAKGAPLGEVPPFKWFASEAPAGDPASADAAAKDGEHDPASAAAEGPPKPQPSATPAVPTMTAGVLGAFAMPSPYDARELHDLEQHLREKLAGVAAQEERLKRRELELADWQRLLELRAQELEALRKSTGDAPASSEASADVPGKPLTPATAASWRALSPLFESGDASEVAEKLGQLDPEEAAQVLRGLDPERCAEILNAMPKDRYKDYLDAWRRSAGIKP